MSRKINLSESHVTKREANGGLTRAERRALTALSEAYCPARPEPTPLERQAMVLARINLRLQGGRRASARRRA